MDFLFYNVENLMDILDNPNKRDNDFTPKGRYSWTKDRYEKKLHNLAEVICNYNGENTSPDLLALCEVENLQVVLDLINQPQLKDEEYQIIHAESDDQRGIDLCFIYKKKSFNYSSHKLINIDRHARNKLHSRDIMVIKGTIPNGSELFIMINHWPSRYDGEKLTRYKRAAAAQTIMEEVNGIYTLEENPKIIICGDFNDDPPSYSLNRILKAGKKGKHPGQLVNLAWKEYNQNNGTIYHDEHWYLFDQFIVSYSMYKRVVDHEMHIVKTDKTIYHSKKNNSTKPNRTYIREKYIGGVSDHLPVWISFE